MSEKMLSAGKGALFLTALSAISQVLGFFYRVALSRMVGAEVMGLYQLVMPVYSVLLSLTAVGLTAAVSNLTPQYLAFHNPAGVRQTVSTCLRAFFLLLLPIGLVVILGYDPISVYILGDARTRLGVVLLVPCVLLTGVENLHKHCFYGIGRVRPPAAVETAANLLVPCVAVHTVCEDEKAVIEKLAPFVAEAEKKKITLLLESTGAMANTKKLVEVLDYFACDHLAACWNAHSTCLMQREAPEQTITNLGAYVRHVRLTDGGELGDPELVGEGALPLRELIRDRCFDPEHPPKLVRAALGNDAGVVGAAMLCKTL